MKKLIYYSFLLTPFLFNCCKSKLFGYDDKVSLPVEKKCLLTSRTDPYNLKGEVINYIYNSYHMPLKGISNDKRTNFTFEYDGKGRWEKYLYEQTDSISNLFNFTYNDTTNLIKEAIQYTSFANGNNLNLNRKLNYFYDSLNRVVKMVTYKFYLGYQEGWSKIDTKRLLYNSKGNLIKIFDTNHAYLIPEYLETEYTEYDDKVNFRRLNPIFQFQNLGEYTDDLSLLYPVPNFSKNNPTKGKFYSPGIEDNIDLNYEYIYNSSGLPTNVNFLIIVSSSGVIKNTNKINYQLNYNCPN